MHVHGALTQEVVIGGTTSPRSGVCVCVTRWIYYICLWYPVHAWCNDAWFIVAQITCVFPVTHRALYVLYVCTPHPALLHAGVNADAHPNTLYLKAGVPAVIASDDPGVLRTSLTEQYVLFVHRYQVSYQKVSTHINVTGIDCAALSWQPNRDYDACWDDRCYAWQ